MAFMTSAINFAQPGLREVLSTAPGYSVQAVMGQGVTSQVVKCVRRDTNQLVALKVIKNLPYNMRTVETEVNIWNKLSKLKVQRSNLVQWHRVFASRDYTCLEFELLDKSLMDLMVQRKCHPLPLSAIRPIIHQLATALYYTKSIGVIHADVKLENVMLVDHKSQPYRVKLIDFGLAHGVSEAKPGSVIQTLFYRSPEVLLGLPYNAAVDMWSLGCLAASLYLGRMLYCGRSEYEMLWYIEQTQGQLPEHLLNNGLNTSRYYKKVDGAWKLKTPAEYFRGKENAMTKELGRALNSLDSLLTVKPIDTSRPEDAAAERRDLGLFVDLLKGMLQLDAAQRISPRLAVQHPFLSMSEMLSHDPQSSYINLCQKRMADCGLEPKPSRTEAFGSSSSSPGSSSIQARATSSFGQGAGYTPSQPGTQTNVGAGHRGEHVRRPHISPRETRRQPEGGRDRARSRSPHLQRTSPRGEGRQLERDRARSRSPHLQRTTPMRGRTATGG